VPVDVLLLLALAGSKHSIPVLISGRAAVMRSPTGSGKMLAYLAPMVHSLAAKRLILSGSFLGAVFPTGPEAQHTGADQWA
jgi:CRISPR/Cas system-associated endonuclease/helicase Cas3